MNTKKTVEKEAQIFERLKRFVQREFAAYYAAKYGVSPAWSEIKVSVNVVNGGTFAALKYGACDVAARGESNGPHGSEVNSALVALAEVFDSKRTEIAREKMFRLRLDLAKEGAA